MDKDLFGKYKPPKTIDRRTERGELLVQFTQKLNVGRKEKGLRPVTIGRVAYMVTSLSLQDLYFILSDCNQAERKGIPWAAAFYTALKPKK